eukprot:TRINITY_DN1675_c0_g1_i3.p1 TRINITY_DN1675_c0_g1~~TRINITY_DN1675_c0_g1_i3.p1  ORF type:complete len:109 (+),score=17.07 TRINITY_DN1675_c0_g1_i3:351-677(+)
MLKDSDDISDIELQSIVKGVSINGFWKKDKLLLNALKLGPDHLDKVNSALGRRYSEEVRMTILILLYLEEKLQDSKPKWQLIYKKADKWLESQNINFTSLKDQLNSII